MPKRRFHYITMFILLIVALLPAQSLVAAEKQIPFSLPPQSELNRIQSAVIQTSKGRLIFELFPDKAPWHVANFKFLADQGFYNKKVFHLIIAGFIVQGGVPPGRPNYSPRYSLPPEFHNELHVRGTLGMARIADDINPERRSHACQFHILLRESPQMDGNYTVFGKLVEGIEILDKISENDVIESVTVYVR